MSITVMAIGVALLIVLAAVIGFTESRAQHEAWHRIAQERRELSEWERELISAAESRGCASCRLLRERAERGGHAKLDHRR